MTSKSDPRGHPGLKLCVHVSVMGYYRFINFHQNRRGSGIFLGDFTWNDPYVSDTSGGTAPTNMGHHRILVSVFPRNAHSDRVNVIISHSTEGMVPSAPPGPPPMLSDAFLFAGELVGGGGNSLIIMSPLIFLGAKRKRRETAGPN